MAGDSGEVTPDSVSRGPRPGGGARAAHLALVCGVAAGVWALNRFGFRIQHPGPVLLVPLAYVAVAGGATAGFVAGLPLVVYYAFHVWHADAADPVRSLALFTVAAVAIALIAGRAATRRQQTVRRAVAEEMGQVHAETGTRLARSEDLNRAVLDSLPASVAVVDGRGRILATNASWQRFQEANGGDPAACGVGSNYLAACQCEGGGGSESGAKVFAGIRSVLSGERDQFTLEYPCHGPAERRWFLLSVTPLAARDSNGAQGAVVAHFDITERKLSEDTTRQRALELAHMARALKRTNEELDQFAYITSHDLRAPLRGIANLSRWIEEDMGERFTPEAHQQMEMLRGRVHRMEAMIDGILEYSRIGRTRLEPEDVDVGRLLAEVIDLLDPAPRFEVEVQGGMPIVPGHKLRLQQVFLNLLGNALKHHDKPAGRIVVACREAGEFHEFAVSDDGPGIEPKYHEKIFVIFQTLQPRDKVEGTGVGLSLVKKIVEAEGGAITVESELGRGTTFRFTWPRRMPQEAKRERSGSAAEDPVR